MRTEWSAEKWAADVEVRRLERYFVMVSDEAMEEYVRSYEYRHNESGKWPSLLPVVRASTYQEGGNFTFRWIEFEPYFCADERRPVMMRGSLHGMEQKYGRRRSSNIFERFMRRIQFTCVNIDAGREFVKNLYHEIEGRWGPFPQGYDLGYPNRWGNGIYSTWYKGVFYGHVDMRKDHWFKEHREALKAQRAEVAELSRLWHNLQEKVRERYRRPKRSNARHLDQGGRGEDHSPGGASPHRPRKNRARLPKGRDRGGAS